MRYLIFFSFIMLFNSCYNEEVTITEEKIYNPPKLLIQETQVVHQLKNLQGENINAQLNFNNQNSETNNISFFDSKMINKYGEALQVKLNNNIVFDLNILNIENQTNYQTIFIPTNLNKKTSQTAPFVIPFSENSNIEIGNNAIYQNDKIYEESVDLHYIEIDSKYLSTYPLNIHMDKESTMFLSFQKVFYISIGQSHDDLYIDRSKWNWDIQDQLYYYDASKGQWHKIDQNNDLKSGYYGIGDQQKGHFVEIEFKGDKALENFTVETIIDDNFTLESKTSSQSKTLLFLPIKSDLNITLKQENETLLTKNTRATNSSLSIDVSNIVIKRVYADIIDCNLDPVQNTFLIQTNSKWSTFYLLKDREYIDVYIPETTENEFHLRVENENSPTTRDSEAASLNLGTYLYCNDKFTDYFIVETNTGFRIFTNVSLEINGTDAVLKAKEGTDKFWIKFPNSNLQMYENKDVNYSFYLQEPIDYQMECFETSVGCGTNTFLLQNFGTFTGDLIQGNFEGEYWIRSITQNYVSYRNLKGSFKFYAN